MNLTGTITAVCNDASEYALAIANFQHAPQVKIISMSPETLTIVLDVKATESP